MSTLMLYLLSFRPRVTEKKGDQRKRDISLTTPKMWDAIMDTNGAHIEMKIKVAAENMELR